ncbi:MAG: hypothetical protein NTZ09_12910 [Candidatus Hydrogenedentes bacterium]|nr:hypothetical protein [Candidatus Hydrogenedentota bacterium]
MITAGGLDGAVEDDRAVNATGYSRNHKQLDRKKLQSFSFVVDRSLDR